MAEIWFYHLMRQPLERVLPPLLEKSIERGWRAVVQAGSEERMRVLDDHLWTYSEESFLAHGTPGDGDPELQPVYLTTSGENPNGAKIRFFVDGAHVDTSGSYNRTILIFDGNDEDRLTEARSQWKRLKVEGHALQYWQQNENGGWEKKA